MFESLRQRSRDPSVNLYLRLMDLDGTSPTTFYMMDEIGRTQVLLEYDWSGEWPVFCDTYEVLYKTELYGKFCLIMRKYREKGLDGCIVMEYYPGTQGRIFMRGLSEASVKLIVDEFMRKVKRRKKRLAFSCATGR